MCGYLGFIPLVLALFALLFRKDRMAILLAALAAGALIIALGSYTPIFKLLYDFLPVFAISGGPRNHSSWYPSSSQPWPPGARTASPPSTLQMR